MAGPPNSLSTILHAIPASESDFHSRPALSLSSTGTNDVDTNGATSAGGGAGGIGAGGGGRGGGGGGGGGGGADRYYSHQNHMVAAANSNNIGRLPSVTLPSPHTGLLPRPHVPSLSSPVSAHSHPQPHQSYLFNHHQPPSHASPSAQQQSYPHQQLQQQQQHSHYEQQQQQQQHPHYEQQQQQHHPHYEQQQQQHHPHYEQQQQSHQHQQQQPPQHLSSSTPDASAHGPHNLPSPHAQASTSAMPAALITNMRSAAGAASAASTPASTSPASAAPAMESSTESPTVTKKPAGPALRHANNTSLYQCAHCQRRYSRPEHLARHIQTHTLGKRFFCTVCNKAFARADLLKRHAANHENDNDSRKRRRTASSAQAAARVSQACRACASARVKCEEVKPCTRCKTRGLDCELNTTEPGSTAAMHLLQLSHSTPTVFDQQSVQNHPDRPAEQTPRQYEQLPDASPDASSYNDSPHTLAPSTVQEFDQSPLSSHPSIVKHDTSHVASSAMIMDPHVYAQAPEQPPADMSHMGVLPFTHFLQGIMYEPMLDPTHMMQAEGMAVLDFCNNNNIELNDIDFSLLDQWNLAEPLPYPQDGPMPEGPDVTAEEPVDLSQLRQTLVKVWTTSPWRWLPGHQDSAYEEQKNFSVTTGDVTSAQFQASKKDLDKVINQKLDSALRDRVLAIVLSTCKTPAMVTQIASSFPSTEVMDTMVHIFLASHLCSVSSWIHFPLFNMSAQWPDWIAVAAAAGGVLTPVPTLRKFGLALQEAVRLTIQGRFEEKNTSIQNMGLLQTLILGQDIGLWSGNRRKMEIAECHLVIPITMMRYRGKFQRASYPVMEVDASDEGEVLEEKWRTWSERESWKRLVFHCFSREAQTSMTTLTNPAMSYSELSLPLPESRELWAAQTAREWKARYLERCAGQPKRPPSIGDVFRDPKILVPNQGRLDIQYTISVCLHGVWHLVLEYRNLHAVMRSRPAYANTNSAMLLSSRHTELIRALDNFKYVVKELGQPFLPQECLLMHVLFMNLYVSLDDLQLFSGKEGEEQARRTYPVLQAWSTTQDARRAVWHAGQAISQAKLFPSRHVKEFNAVAVHHAALAIWTYGVVTKASKRRPPQPAPCMAMHYSSYGGSPAQQDDSNATIVPLDGPEFPAVDQFIAVGTGRPVIRGPDSAPMEAGLDDPKACMEVVQRVLMSNFGGRHNMPPPIVDNLCHLIARLGDAASAVDLGDVSGGAADLGDAA